MTREPARAPMLENADLAALQEALVELLLRELSPEETRRVLAEDPVYARHRDWVESFTSPMIEVAQRLVAAWARAD